MGGFFERFKMLIRKVCERAFEAIIDELAVASLNEAYPANLSVLIDAMIDLSDFNSGQMQIKYGNEIPPNNTSGGSLVFNLLAAASMTLDYKNSDQLDKYAKLLTYMCQVSERFKTCFITSVSKNEDGAESYRFELGDGSVDVCTAVLESIK